MGKLNAVGAHCCTRRTKCGSGEEEESAERQSVVCCWVVGVGEEAYGNDSSKGCSELAWISLSADLLLTTNMIRT